MHAVSTAWPTFVNGVNVEYLIISTTAGTTLSLRNVAELRTEVRVGVAARVQSVWPWRSVTVLTNAQAASGFLEAFAIDSESSSYLEPILPQKLGILTAPHWKLSLITGGMYFPHQLPLRYIPSCCVWKKFT